MLLCLWKGTWDLTFQYIYFISVVSHFNIHVYVLILIRTMCMVNYQRLCPILYIELAYVSERRQVEEATYHRVLGCSPALAVQLFQLSIWRHRGSHSMWTCVCPPVALTSTVLQMSWPVIVTYLTGDRRGEVSTPVPPRIQIDICEEWLCTKWHPVPYIVLWGSWSSVVYYTGNVVAFGSQDADSFSLTIDTDSDWLVREEMSRRF